MTGWGNSRSQTGSRTAPSGEFSCGFNIVGRLGSLHEASHAVGLGLKIHGTHTLKS